VVPSTTVMSTATLSSVAKMVPGLRSDPSRYQVIMVW